MLMNRLEADLKSSIRSIVVELSPEKPAMVEGSHRLIEDMGYHSLALLELAFALEDEFELAPIDEQTARGILTVADVEGLVMGQLRERAS